MKIILAILALTMTYVIPNLGSAYAITQFVVSFPIADEIRDTTKDVEIPVGTLITVAVNDYFDPEYVWKYNGSGFYLHEHSSGNEAEADDDAAHVDCCGDHNDSVLLAVSDDLAVGEHVDVCEAPTMLKPTCDHGSVNKYKVVHADFYRNVDVINAFNITSSQH